MESTAKGVVSMQDCYYWATLHISMELGPRSLLYLYRYFGSGKAVFEADPGEFRNIPLLSPQVAEKIIACRNSLTPEKTAQELISSNIKVTVLGDPDYPKLLAEIPDPPVVIYSRGRLPGHEMPLIAIVGARRATPYGRVMAKKLAEDLTNLGWGVVSGMARGIDTAAHEGAIAGNGYTLAVLGCGVDVCYPRENQKLYEKIAEMGCLLSEFPPGTHPQPKNFPIRNRIISGCSLGTLVVEAGERSGALITANFALEQGRDVFAVPGSVTSIRSRGTNNLIKQGAKLVESAEDVIAEYPYLSFSLPASQECPVKRTKLPPEEAAVYKYLNLEPTHIDQLAELTGMPVSMIGSILTMLELKGLAKRLNGDYYISADLSRR